MNKYAPAFGRLFRSLRKSRGLSQATFAAKAGWPQTTVSRIESGRRAITLDELFPAAAVLGLALRQLLMELQCAGGSSPCAEPAVGPAAEPGYSLGFAAAFADETMMLAQLARYGMKFSGSRLPPFAMPLPDEETLLAALKHSADPRIFEVLPAFILKRAAGLDWGKTIAGAYQLRLQNRLGMAVAAALELAASAGAGKAATQQLTAAKESLAQCRLDRDEVVGPMPKTAAGLALRRRRTPAWLRYWHGLGTVDLQSLTRHL